MNDKKFNCIIYSIKIVLMIFLLIPVSILLSEYLFIAIPVILGALLINGVFCMYLRRKKAMFFFNIIDLVLLLFLVVMMLITFLLQGVDESAIIIYSLLIAALFYIVLDFVVNNIRSFKPFTSFPLKSDLLFYCIKMLMALLLCTPLSFLFIYVLGSENEYIVIAYLLYLAINGLFYTLLKRRRIIGTIFMTIINIIDLFFIIFSIILFVKLTHLAFSNIGEAGFAFLIYPAHFAIFFYGILALFLNNTGISNFKLKKDIKVVA